ncbi:MAG: hypothetical protein HFF72_10675 [Oscillospiraceae bacterium]|nr:hypothetical protein [Oscillospiraceae bacterium]MCI8942217.1 hypothetical protein [Oscillospiraceae bacterium]
MSDFEEKLNAILSNPESMGQIMNLAQSLNLGGGGEPSGEGGPAAPQPEAPPENASSGIPDGLSGLGSLLGQIDPKLIGRLLPLAGELAGGGNDERMQLLYALRPFLKPERRDKVERAAKTARLIHVGKKLLQSLGENDV